MDMTAVDATGLGTSSAHDNRLEYQRVCRGGGGPVAKKPKLVRNTELSGASAGAQKGTDDVGKEYKMMN
jgi:hypothetical protein